MHDFIDMRSDEYALLYARFLENGPDRLLEHSGGVGGKFVLDLCAGGCRLSRAALDSGALLSIAVDISEEMMGESMDRLEKVVHNLENGFPAGMFNVEFDAVFCQQGVNYWWNEKTVADISRNMGRDGVFVFNTFNKKPSAGPEQKFYKINGVEYSETYYLEDGEVVHIQKCGGRRHMSVFRWIRPVDFGSVLRKHFGKVERVDFPSTTIWKARCPR